MKNNSTPRVLVWSHPSVLEVNRAPFQWLSRVSQCELSMIVPETWRGDLISDLRYEPKASDTDANVNVVPWPVHLSGNGSLFFYRRGLAAVVRQLQPDIVFVDDEPWSLAALQAYALAPSSSHCFIYTKQNLRKRLPPPFNWIQQRILRRSTAAFAVASEVADVLRWKGCTAPIKLLPHSYEPTVFKRLEGARRAAERARLGIPSGSVCYSYFGRLVPEKGIHNLMDAQKRLSSGQGPRSVFFLWVGSGILDEEVRAHCDKLGPEKARYMSAIPHGAVASAIAASDVLVLPSLTTKTWKEQFGRILVEAWACGVPVVGSNSGEIPRLIETAQGGVVFPEGDTTALTGALAAMLNASVRSTHATSGESYVRAHLSHEVVARQLGLDLRLTLRT